MMSKQRSEQGEDAALAVMLLPGDAEALPFEQSGEELCLRYWSIAAGKRAHIRTDAFDVAGG